MARKEGKFYESSHRCLTDIIAYRVGFTTENEEENIAKFRIDEMMDNILLETGVDSYQGYFSDNKENNYRFRIDPQYKANRVAPKPKHHEFIKEYMIRNWGITIAHGMEADDALGINQKENETIICSIDKDLHQIPGQHYNFVKKEFFTVSPHEGMLSFYRSFLIGDVADNIKGIRGIGPAKAKKFLPDHFSEDQVLDVIIEWYKKEYGEKWETVLNCNGQLLKIKQSEDEELWELSKLKPTGKTTQLFMQQVPEASNLYTERIIVVPRNSDGFPVAGQKTEDFFPTPAKAVP